MEKCFVIQPFDNDKYDKRFKDIFEPAINNAGFEAYRVDRDNSVVVPIEDIENGIATSSFCFAEITTNNPNVWYELGFAYACNKSVILVCSEERENKFPFDIQHKFIITYKTSSTSDFDILKDKITSKINALRKRSAKFEKLTTLPLKESEGLQNHEVAIMLLVMENCISIEESVAIYNLKNDMDRSGFTNAATSVGIRTLVNYGLLEVVKENDYNGNEFYGCKLTEDGDGWILANQHLLKFKKSDLGTTQYDIPEDDLPF